MKEKCQALQTSIAIASISLFFCLLLWAPLPSPFPKYAIEFFQMLFGGVLGSSVVTLVIYATEYRIQKRIALTDIWSETKRINQHFSSIQYLHLSCPIDLVMNYFNEEWYNAEMIKLGFQINHSCRIQWARYLLEEFRAMGEYVSEEDIMDVVTGEAAQCLNSLNRVIDDYISIANETWSEWVRLFDAVQFFSGNKPLKKLLQEIYAPMDQKRCLIDTQACPHFTLYKKSSDSYNPEILNKLIVLQNQFFTIESDEMGTHIYNDFCTEMNNKLEDFHASICGDTPHYCPRLHVLTIHSTKN